MTRDIWIIETLTDLGDFAAANGLPRVSAAARELAALAAEELAARDGPDTAPAPER